MEDYYCEKCKIFIPNKHAEHSVKILLSGTGHAKETHVTCLNWVKKIKP